MKQSPRPEVREPGNTGDRSETGGGEEGKPAPHSQEPEETTTKPRQLPARRRPQRDVFSSDDEIDNAPAQLISRQIDSDDEIDRAFALRTSRRIEIREPEAIPKVALPLQSSTARRNDADSEDSDEEQLFRKIPPKGGEYKRDVPKLETNGQKPNGSHRLVVPRSRYAKAAAKRLNRFSSSSNPADNGKEQKTEMNVKPATKNIHGNASSDEDIHVLIDNEINKRIAAIAAGDQSFRDAGNSVTVGNAAGYPDGNALFFEKEASGTDSDHETPAQTPEGANAQKKKNLTLKNLLNKIKASGKDANGFNDIIQDAIHDKLHQSRSRGSGRQTSPSKQETVETTSCMTPARRNLFSAETYVPKTSPIDDSPPPKSVRKSPNEPFKANRAIFKDRKSRSARDLHDMTHESVRKDGAIRPINDQQNDARASRRLQHYLKAEIKRRNRSFFLAAWYMSEIPQHQHVSSCSGNILACVFTL